MSPRLPTLCLLLLGLTACSPPPEAPTELGELTTYLFANFDDPDPLVLQAGLVNMVAFLEDFEAEADLGVDSTATGRSWSVPALQGAARPT